MSATAWVVVLLSVIGLVSEFLGIVMVSGRWEAFTAWLRRPSTQTLTPDFLGPTSKVFAPGISSSDPMAVLEARYQMIMETQGATLSQLSDVEARLGALEERLPGEVKRHSMPPLLGMVLLLVGLVAFVAANVVGLLA